MARNRILVACFLWAALPALARAQQTSLEPMLVDNVASKLGVKPMVNAPRELEPGRSVTTTLVDPKKIAPYGIKNMHEGARVTMTCVGADRVRVEADEMEPVEQRETVTLKVNADGSLTPVPPPTPKGDRPPFR